jgi:SNF family Na+-dependent transporter
VSYPFLNVAFANIQYSLVAYPLFLYESVVGYYIRNPPIQALSMINRRWSTVALGQVIMLFIVLGYYSTITSYCLVFLVGSCKDPMPWTAEAQGTETDAEAAQKYWYDDVLNNFSPEELGTRSNGDLGGLNGSVVGALAVTWFLTFMAMAFGKDLVEQITRVTVIAPIFIMILMVSVALV